MIFIDLFFLTIYRFLKRIGRSKENAKFSALSFLAVYVPFSLITISYVVGLIEDNNISHLLLEEKIYLPTSITISVIIYFFFGIRYYRIIDVENIEQIVLDLSVIKRRVLKTLVYFFMITVPISFYVSFRLYTFGYV